MTGHCATCGPKRDILRHRASAAHRKATRVTDGPIGSRNMIVAAYRDAYYALRHPEEQYAAPANPATLDAQAIALAAFMKDTEL